MPHEYSKNNTGNTTGKAAAERVSNGISMPAVKPLILQDGKRSETPVTEAPAQLMTSNKQASSPVIQRQPVELSDPAKDGERQRPVITDFKRVQAFLTDAQHYTAVLAALNAEVEEQIKNNGEKRALSSVLLKREQQFGINSEGAPIYTGGLSGADFNKMLTKAVIPKDVGETSRHGEQTHRLQWYVVLWCMSSGFTQDPVRDNHFTNAPRDLLLKSTKVQVLRANFPVPLARGANVWHALFDMAMDVPDSDAFKNAIRHDMPLNLSQDVMTSADLLGPALHGAPEHLASRRAQAEGWPELTGTLTRHAPLVAEILKKNYNKRLQSERDLGEGDHLRAYHAKKLQQAHVEPAWSKDHNILVIPKEIHYIGHLINDQHWDTLGKGFFWGTKVPDGIAKMRTAYREQHYGEIFKIAKAKNRKNDSDRSPVVRDLYEALEKVGNENSKDKPVRMRELGHWEFWKGIPKT